MVVFNQWHIENLTLDLDSNTQGAIPVVYGRQGDKDGILVNITLNQQGTPVDSGVWFVNKRVFFEARGNGISVRKQVDSIEQGVVKVVLPEALFSNVGLVKENFLRIEDATTGQTIIAGTTSFQVYVRQGNLDPDASKYYLEEIEVLVADFYKWVKAVKGTITNNAATNLAAQIVMLREYVNSLNIETVQARGIYGDLATRLKMNDILLSEKASKIDLQAKRNKADLIVANDLSPQLLGWLQNGGGGATINIDSVPKDYSVSHIKTDFLKVKESQEVVTDLMPVALGTLGVYYDPSTGNPVTNSATLTYKATGKITKGDFTSFKSFGVQSWIFYTTANARISAQEVNADVETVVNIPANTSYMIGNVKDFYFPALDPDRSPYPKGVARATISTTLVKYKMDDLLISEYNLSEDLKIALLLRYKNKTFVNFGDSIIENKGPSISDLLSKELGVNAINGGFGGCMMSPHPNAEYAKFSMTAIAEAIVTNVWTLQDNAVGVPASFKETVARLKLVNFATAMGGTISYGTNDWLDSKTLDNPADPYDKTTILGALRWSVRRIQQVYPNFRIYITTPIFRLTNDRTENSNNWKNANNVYMRHVVDGYHKAGEDMKVQVIDLFYGMGINEWNQSVYFPPTDGTHPNTFGRTIWAQTAAEAIKGNTPSRGASATQLQELIDTPIAPGRTTFFKQNPNNLIQPNDFTRGYVDISGNIQPVGASRVNKTLTKLKKNSVYRLQSKKPLTGTTIYLAMYNSLGVFTRRFNAVTVLNDTTEVLFATGPNDEMYRLSCIAGDEFNLFLHEGTELLPYEESLVIGKENLELSGALAQSSQTDFVDVVRRHNTSPKPMFAKVIGDRNFWVYQPIAGGKYVGHSFTKDTNDDFVVYASAAVGVLNDGTFTPEQYLMAGSNKEFAFRLRPNGSTTDVRWFPEHESIGTAFATSQSIMFDEIEKVGQLSPGEMIEVSSVTLAQVVSFKYPNVTDSLGTMTIITSVTSEGVTYNGKVVWLKDVEIERGYVGMLPTVIPPVNALKTSAGKTYPLLASGETSLTERDAANSYAFVNTGLTAPNHKYVLAQTLLNPTQTLRKGQQGRREPFPLWLEHRSSTVQKLYMQVFQNHIAKAGETFSFGATLYVGILPYAGTVLN